MDTLKTATQEHIICKQIIELTLFKKENAKELQKIINELYHTRILPELDLKLSEMIAPESFLRIDRLEINMGTLLVKDLKHEFKNKLIGCFTKEVAQKMCQYKPSYTSASKGTKKKAKDKITDSIAHSIQPSDSRILSNGEYKPEMFEYFLPLDSRILSNEEYKLEMLEYFLQNGVLPWWSQNRSEDALEGILSDLIKNAPAQLKTLMQKIVKHENARSRLIYQFPDTIFYRLARILIPDKTIRIRSLFYDLNEIFKDTTSIPHPGSEFRLIFWDAVLMTALAPLKKESLEKAIFKTVIDSIERKCRPSLQPDNIDDATVPKSEALTQIEQFYIQNAGIVILWPYLNTFFQQAGLLKDSGFISDNSNIKAIHLLEYLVTGKQYTSEHLLVLNKLICGWDIYKPICKGLMITKAEKKEAEILLSTIISHWQALKNTSIEGLRTSFLQREGVLIKKEQTWLLRVERKAHDMLLGRLPWGISIVKLSWMKITLYVEW